ncbi:MAG: serine/threonine protein kinase, partial [Bradymonadia bacterium]
MSQTLTAFGTAEFEAALIQTVAPQRVTITLDSVVAQLGHKRIWRGSDGDGQRYRVEERSSASKERVPTNISGLSMLVDIPLGQTDHGAHEVKVYREVAGQLLHERLEARDSPLTPTEIVEWIRPIIAAMETIHNAGFFCLRFCPYTVKYVDDGDGVFLQGVEVLYPRDAPLAKLPAIAGYTAPEVYEASVGDPLTGAADVYGIAMTLYYLIAGSDPPASLYTAYTPAILARDFNPDFPLGFAPVLGLIGALAADERPSDAETLLEILEEARDRSVRQIAGIERVRVG